MILGIGSSLCEMLEREVKLSFHLGDPRHPSQVVPCSGQVYGVPCVLGVPEFFIASTEQGLPPKRVWYTLCTVVLSNHQFDQMTLFVSDLVVMQGFGDRGEAFPFVHGIL